MKVWKFSIEADSVRYGNKKRIKFNKNGCNEPFRDRYWCPKLQWFRKEPCPFMNLQECENYAKMCGEL